MTKPWGWQRAQRGTVSTAELEGEHARWWEVGMGGKASLVSARIGVGSCLKGQRPGQGG